MKSIRLDCGFILTAENLNDMSQTIDYPSDSSQEIVVQIGALKQLLVKLYVNEGMFKAPI